MIDFDTVEPGNLIYSVLYRENVGHPKCFAAVDAVRRHFPTTLTSAHNTEISGLGFNALRDVDLILSCVDSDWARLDIAYVARQLSLPVCDAGMGSLGDRRGRVSFFPKAPDSACYGCLLSSGHRRELLCARDFSSNSCTAETPGNGTTTAPWPGSPMTASAVAAVQIDHGLRSITKGTRMAYSLRMDFGETPSVERILHQVAITCPFHEFPGSRVPAVPGETPRDLLRRSGSQRAILLDWPVCVDCRCGSCGHRWRPMRRAATLRRGGICPACGFSGLQLLEVIEWIGLESPWSATPFLDLGVPEGHLHLLVEAEW